MPFEEWVKSTKCNNCGKLGHIKRDCPDLKSTTGNSTYRKPYHKPRGDRNNHDNRRNKQGKDKNDRYGKKICQFKQAYNAVLEQLTVEDSSSGSKSEENNDSGNKSDGSESTKDFAAHTARVMSSLKE